MSYEGRRGNGLYWDRAWKLVEGCTKVSPGCDNCWSETETAMRSKHPNKKISVPARRVIGDVGDFYGQILIRDDRLDLPLKTKNPTVFAIWNDLFHEDVSDDFRDKAYAVMALCPQHTFLVLTKRAQRMAEYWSVDDRKLKIINNDIFYWKSKDGDSVSVPLRNVWHGVTCENQEQADIRSTHLLQVPGKRFVSIEPMLGPIDLSILCSATELRNIDGGPGLDAVLLGGESGKNARPMHPDWVRSVRDQCQAAGVPFFFKQWGEFGYDRHGSDTSKAKSHITMFPGLIAKKVGKRKAGRMIDGHTHDDLPWDNNN